MVGLRILWAPWRASYVESAGGGDGCIFCDKPRENRDQENYILLRGRWAFVMLNKYPYNTGHLMIAPYRHEGDIKGLTDEEAGEVFRLLKVSIEMLRRAFKPDGFNVGLNLGRVAGAGVEGHIHIHVVPRWLGDTNFMPVIADTKVLPMSLYDVYKRLRKTLEKL